MRLELHPLISSDILQITRYYEDIAGRRLADEFYTSFAPRS